MDPAAERPPAPPPGTYELAMFPLGTALLPGMALPLQVFEPRYRVMMRRVLASERPEFGVVLIERGHEVGGGDTRTDVGCVASVVASEESADGRLMVLAVGDRRVRVERWLPEDPHPLAAVTDWPDAPPDEADETPPDLDRLTDEVVAVARLAARLGGGHLPEHLDFSADPAARTFELATLAPLGALDRHRLLAAPTMHRRMALLAELVLEQQILLEARSRFEEG